MFDWVCVLYFIIVGHLLLAVNLDLMMSSFPFSSSMFLGIIPILTTSR